MYHIEYAPEQPEPYYKATGKELQPRPVGEEHGIIVYNYMPISAVHYVSQHCQNFYLLAFARSLVDLL